MTHCTLLNSSRNTKDTPTQHILQHYSKIHPLCTRTSQTGSLRPVTPVIFHTALCNTVYTVYWGHCYTVNCTTPKTRPLVLQELTGTGYTTKSTNLLPSHNYLFSLNLNWSTCLVSALVPTRTAQNFSLSSVTSAIFVLGVRRLFLPVPLWTQVSEPDAQTQRLRTRTKNFSNTKGHSKPNLGDTKS